MRKFFHIVLIFLSAQTVFGQEIPLNSQIFMNPYYYNPAFAGYEDRAAFYVYRRHQWSGIEGAPVTSGFNFHTIFNKKVNFGIHINNDERSILSTTRGLITFGYRASFSEFHYFSFALSGGVGFNSIDLDAIDSNDPAIIGALDNNLFLDGNAGFNYYNNGFNLGLSLPKIFKTNTLSSSSFILGEISPLNDVTFMTSYKWEISEDKFAIEPHGIYYYDQDLPGQFEVIGLIHLMDVLWLGASYRQDYGSTGYLGLNISDNFKFGYAYEFFNAEQANFNNGTHDIQLAIIFGKKEKKGKVNLIEKRRNMLRSMGKLPAQQNQNEYQVQNDPFVPPPADIDTYNEEDALQDLLDEMNAEEDTINIFNIQFDDEITGEAESIPIVAPVIVATSETEIDADEINDENELINQMMEEADEITFDATEELTDVEDITEVSEPIEEESIETVFDDEGYYIGPTTVTKGNHLLELETGNYVVVGTFRNYRDAEEYSDQLFIKGIYTKFGYLSRTKTYYVYIYNNHDLRLARAASKRFIQIGVKLRENWVLQVQ